MNTRNLPSIFASLNRLDPFAIGFDDLFSRLDAATTQQVGFPKYNIDHFPDDITKISFALAGYDEKEIKITHEGNQLTISADISTETADQNGSAGFRGIAHRSFSQKFILGEHIEVQDATFKNGLLVVTMQKIVPEHAKAKLIPINKK